MMKAARHKDVWAIVPINGFSRSKSRLTGALNAHERATLAKAMAADVLEQLSRTRGLSGVLVVTSDPDAHALAADFGVSVVSDPAEPGINAAALQGIHTVSRFRNHPAITIVPADLPFITSAELESVVDALGRHAVVIAEATRDGGTNILGLSPPDAIAPAFGPDSFERHISRARRVGIEPLMLSLAGAGHDIDVPSDLIIDGRLRGGPRTLACLISFRQFMPRRRLELVTQ